MISLHFLGVVTENFIFKPSLKTKIVQCFFLKLIIIQRETLHPVSTTLSINPSISLLCGRFNYLRLLKYSATNILSDFGPIIHFKINFFRPFQSRYKCIIFIHTHYDVHT